MPLHLGYLLQNLIDIPPVRRQRVLLLVHTPLDLLLTFFQATLSLVDLGLGLLGDSAKLAHSGFEIFRLRFEIPQAGLGETEFILRGVESGLDVVLFGLGVSSVLLSLDVDSLRELFDLAFDSAVIALKVLLIVL